MIVFEDFSGALFWQFMKISKKCLFGRPPLKKIRKQKLDFFPRFILAYCGYLRNW